jgi:hypothetical protein
VADEELRVEHIAERVVAMVLESSVGGKETDRAGLVMGGAYFHAFRRFTAIRILVAAGAGEGAMILARSLLSIAARAGYVDQHEDPEERERRYRQYKKRLYSDALETLEGGAALGIVDADRPDIAETRAHLAELEDSSMLPPDRQLLELVGLEPFYHAFYRRLSDYQHFSLDMAIGELLGVEQLRLGQPEPELAREALKVAVLSYGVLLHLSERTLEHDLGQRTLSLVQASPDFADDASSGVNSR